MKTIQNWKNNLSRMENNYSKKEELNTAPWSDRRWSAHFSSKKRIIIQKPPKKTRSKIFLSSLSKLQFRNLYLTRSFLHRFEEEFQIKKRATNIKLIPQDNYSFQINSIDSFMLKVFSKEDDPIHINSIITKIEELGYIFEAGFRKYDVIKDYLKNNQFMFLRVRPGYFKLRDGFKGATPDKISISRKKIPEIIHLTIKDVVLSIAKDYPDTDIKPYQMYFVVKSLGFNCSYSTVRRAMQNNNFIKNNNIYRLNIQ